MSRALLVTLALALTAPTTALACSEHVKAKLDALAKGQTHEQAEATAARKMAEKSAKERAKARKAADSKAATPSAQK
ncbi:MAG TPA: hypothetical protein VF794_10010 [Archangium sp.]|jgi:hypothetical protein|uniref:hypothetical protein n=1 Tax=Archangium sp. TaxID=1872627 RepID=UPI002ED96731